ncbi:MAG: DUF4493 domain-containing protein [Candidatus Cryptobacteroides sp.]
MKKTITIASCIAVLALSSCKQDKFDYGSVGTLSFANCELSVSEDLNRVTKAAEAADDSYMLYLYDTSNGSLVWEKNYGTVKAMTDGVSLPAGEYRLDVRSTAAEVPAAKFNSPVYGTSESFTISVGQTTNVGTLTCTLLQSAVSVGYNDGFLESVTGDGAATVEITSGYPLEYKLTYNAGSTPTYDRRTGYFAVNNRENTTMTVTYKGNIEGKLQKMTTSIAGIQARDWHIITFMKKVEATGNSNFAIVIDGLVMDTTLDNNLTAGEEGDGKDPNAPAGDGGIKLVSTCSYDITQPIVVPTEPGTFALTMQAEVPNGARKFTVDIASTNVDFINSVNTVGGTTLDLINPAEAAMGIFDIVPFPHGSELLGATTIDFDLSNAQTPLLAFVGTHSFTMNVTDNKGCKNSIVIELVVE